MAAQCITSKEFTVVESARILRSSITELTTDTPELPTTLTLENFQNGQAESPNILMKFVNIFLSGSQDTKMSYAT